MGKRMETENWILHLGNRERGGSGTWWEFRIQKKNILTPPPQISCRHPPGPSPPPHSPRRPPATRPGIFNKKNRLPSWRLVADCVNSSPSLISRKFRDSAEFGRFRGSSRNFRKTQGNSVEFSGVLYGA